MFHPVLPLLIFALLASATAAPKARKAAKPATPPPIASAHVRLWKGDFASGRTVRVQVVPARAKTPAVDFQPDGKEPAFTEYTPLPAGPCSIAPIDPAKPGAKPNTIARVFTPNSFTTLIVREGVSEPCIEIIDDTPTADEMDAELTVRNFASGLTHIRLRARDTIDVRLRAPHAYLHMRGLDQNILLLETTANTSDGKESKWANEIDFKKARKATVLIFSDPYGRIRPRVTLDGALPAAATHQPQNATELDTR